MAVKKGTLSIDSENIFPIIKKWVYSDHDIFVRELISNGCDAVTKLKKLDMMGEYELPEDYKAKIEVIVNPEEKTMKFIDNGLGMTAEEVEEYITQIAFSGATQFLEKYKDKTTEDDMIGHFGLGFYSAFMVADEVQIDTLSYKEGASAVHWASQGGTEYEMQEGNKETVGTEITLFLNEDSLAFANEYRAREVIEKYCSFMPVEIFLSKANAQPEYETIDEEDVLDTDEVVEHITEEVKKSDDQNAADIIDHSESSQKDFQAQRNPLAEQAEHSQRKSDIRSHRYGQATLGRSSRRHEIIDQHRNQHTAARRHDGQKRLPETGQFAHQYLTLYLQSHTEEKDSHQSIVDKSHQGHVMPVMTEEIKFSYLKMHLVIPKGGINIPPRRIGQEHSQQDYPHQQHPSINMIVRRPLEGKVQVQNFQFFHIN